MFEKMTLSIKLKSFRLSGKTFSLSYYLPDSLRFFQFAIISKKRKFVYKEILV